MMFFALDSTAFEIVEDLMGPRGAGALAGRLTVIATFSAVSPSPVSTKVYMPACAP